MEKAPPLGGGGGEVKGTIPACSIIRPFNFLSEPKATLSFGEGLGVGPSLPFLSIP